VTVGYDLDIYSSQGYILSMTPVQIKRLMKELGFTQQQLADAIGAHRVTIADWTRSASKPTGLYLKALNELAAKAKRKSR
jgi:DNA-binding transcriptional regulator YiaG